jgi:hypothetical protein
LPATQFDYRDDKTGKTRRIDFAGMIPGLISSFAKTAERIPFTLADADNRHTMDPERERGTVTRAVRWEDLPAKVQASITSKAGKPMPGLWTKIRFPDEESAAAVLRSEQRLGVSARIREGKEGPRLVHVLGTSDPKVTNLGDWTEDADLSVYASGELLDLSNAQFPEDAVGKKRQATINLATLTDDDVLEGRVTDADLDAMTDEELAQFVEKFSHLTDSEDGDGDQDDDEGGDDEDTDADDEGDDIEGDDTDTTTEAKLSRVAQRQIDLANSRAERAEQQATEVMRRTVKRDWASRRAAFIAKGIPPEAVDLCEPVLARPDALVVDLSNTSFGGEEVEVAEIVETLLSRLEGTIDLGHEIGHYGSGEDDIDGGDIDAQLEAQFEVSFPHLTGRSAE